MPKTYEEIASQLRQRINAGEWEPGARLPSETRMSSDFGVSTPTIRQALTLLRTEGLLDTHHGRGTFLRAPGQMVVWDNEDHHQQKRRAHQDRNDWLQTGPDPQRNAEPPVRHNIRHHERAADEDLAKVFDVAVGTPLLERVSRARYEDEPAPHDLTTSYMVHAVAAANPELLDAGFEPWPGGTQARLHTLGIKVARVVEEVLGAGSPTRQEADELAIPTGGAVLRLTRRYLDADGRTLEWSRTTLPGDRTRLRFTTRLD